MPEADRSAPSEEATRPRSAIFVAPFDELVDPRLVAELARDAEARGWDGFFVWDHVVYREPVQAVADPWTVLAAIAAATTRVRIGALVSPLARYRPWTLARTLTTLDQLSDGRLTLGVGLGSDNSRELSGFGEITDDRIRAQALDEALEVLAACWSGEPVAHDGPQFHVHSVPFLPRPVQTPAPPCWVASRGEATRPLRRAARYEGWFPIELAGPEALTAGLARIQAERDRLGRDGPFDVAVTGEAGEDPAPWIRAGATWWLTGFGLQPVLADVRAAIAAGPPV